MEAFDLKEWLKHNDPADFLNPVEAEFYRAACAHNAHGNTTAMQINAEIITKYQKKAYSAARTG